MRRSNVTEHLSFVRVEWVIMSAVIVGLAKRSLAFVDCWRALSKLDGTTEIAALVDFTFAHAIAPLQVRSELIGLTQLMADIRPERALEIGTCGGGTLFLLCKQAAARATIISIDLPRDRFGFGYSTVRIPLYKRFAGENQNLHLLRADSHSADTLACVKNILQEKPLDYLFIDGDHSYEGVRKDFEMYAPLVKRAGTVAFHDVVPHPLGWSEGVPRFWQEMKGQYPSREIVTSQTNGYGIGIITT